MWSVPWIESHLRNEHIKIKAEVKSVTTYFFISGIIGSGARCLRRTDLSGECCIKNHAKSANIAEMWSVHCDVTRQGVYGRGVFQVTFPNSILSVLFRINKSMQFPERTKVRFTKKGAIYFWQHFPNTYILYQSNAALKDKTTISTL